MAKNVLELNGKRYDAITGAYLGVSVSATATPPVSKRGKQPSKGRVIDGFIRPTGTNAHIVTPAKPKPAAHVQVVHAVEKPVKVRSVAPSAKVMHASAEKADVAKPAKKPVVAAPIVQTTAAPTKPAAPAAMPHSHTPATNAKAHKPEKSKTLMRRAVHKPEIAMKPSIKPQAPAEVAPKSASDIAVKPSVLQVDEDRLERAKDVKMAKGIRHFQPVRPDYSPQAIESTPRASATSIPVISVQHAPLITPQQQHEDGDIFEAALARAQSHRQPAVRPQKKRAKHRGLVNALAGIAAFMVIGGFITYLNMPNIQLRVASVQAGFTANMPAYKPEGYALKGGVQRIGNTVSMHFMAGENNYTVTQQPSDWNSQTLVDNTVALSTGTYKTIQAGGRNVYVYGKNNAVWVDGGVRYDLTANASLSTQDITQLAASL